jgi:hypothetical protein
MYDVFNSKFSRKTAEKMLDLKSIKGYTKAEELEAPCPEPPSQGPGMRTIRTIRTISKVLFFSEYRVTGESPRLVCEWCK